MADERWLLGVDGGGSKTAAHVARVDDGVLHVMAKTTGGPSNLRALGAEAALANLDDVIDRALEEASAPRIDRAVLALAGSQSAEAADRILAWAEARKLAASVSLAHDIDPVLAIAAVHPQPLALIAGTGSAAAAKHPDGHRIVVGGWGHWIGDRGSAFDIGRRAIAAVADAADGLGPPTALENVLLAHFDVDSPREIVTRFGSGDTRRIIAGCAVHVTRAADSDDIARGIVNEAAGEAARLLLAASEQAQFGSGASLAVAGGVVCGSESYRAALLEKLAEAGRQPSRVAVVDHPADGCLQMALD
jgi:N-acetylglucosamine kinase-like BadF-type ATPase